MKSIIKSVAIVAIAFLLCSEAYSQIPRIISYQGVLTDPNGNLLPDGNHHLKLVLYNNAFGATPLYTETQTVPVVRGVFNVLIGTSTPIPTTLTFDRAYFLGVSVDGGPELQPRTPLTSVPYALHAAMADNVSDNAPVVRSVNGLTGALTINGGSGVSVSQNGNDITITNTAAPGTGNNSGFVLPYAGSVSTPSTAFKVTNTNNGLDAYAVHGVLDNIAAGLQSAAVRGENKATGSISSGSGVFGSHSGGGWGMQGTSVSGVGSQGTSITGRGVAGLSTDNTGLWGMSVNKYGVEGGSTNHVAGHFELANTSNNNNAVEAITAGLGFGAWNQGKWKGTMALAIDSTTVGGVGLKAEANGKLASAVWADAKSWNTLTYGVYGISRSKDSASTGVAGNNTSLVGQVYGTTGSVVSSDTNSAGVKGITTNRGAGVIASYVGSSSGNALEINNGYIKVTGSTNRTAFIHTAQLFNTVTNQTRLSYPGMDATDILIVTANGAAVPASEYGVYWTGSEWRIVGYALTFMPIGTMFNVLVIKQKG